MKTLENIINSVKKYRGKLIAGVLIPIILVGSVYANKLKLKINPIDPVTSTSALNIQHYNGLYGKDPNDISFIQKSSDPNGALDIYSCVYFDPNGLSTNNLSKDNMTTAISEIKGRNLSTPKDAELEVLIEPVYGEENMINKKIITRVYDANQTPDVADDILIGTYDFWNMNESKQTISLQIKNGISYRNYTNFYNTNMADFNNDTKVNFIDYAILAKDWKKEGNYLTDISGPNNISDGKVDGYDLVEFSDNWLE